MRKRKQNPKGKHLPGATAAQQRQYEAIKKSLVKRGSPLAEAKRIAAATVRSRQNPLSSEAEKLARELGLSSGEMSLLSAKSPAFQMKFLRKMKADKAAVEKKESKAATPAQKASAEKSKRSFLSRLGTRLRVIGQSQKFKVSARDLGRCKHKIVKVRGRHETDALSKARSQLGSGFDDLKVVNPFRRIKNAGKYIDIVIRGQAKKTPEGWKLGKKTFPQGRGTTKVSSGYYLDRNTGLVYGKRERNRVGRRNESVSMGFWEGGVFHPIRASDDYDPEAVGERYQYAPKKRKSRKKKVAKPAKKRGNPRRKGLHGAYAKLHKMGVRRKSYIATSRRQIRKATKRNPSPAEIRREFAGRYDKDSRLFFPDGTPHGLAKLGKLLAIKT
ncbi:MAG: hypothetical protein J2P41_23250, partial [Blastocatellia bacterium]|nr:hypothetical protein [Blastocatellia bacterium]